MNVTPNLSSGCASTGTLYWMVNYGMSQYSAYLIKSCNACNSYGYWKLNTVFWSGCENSYYQDCVCDTTKCASTNWEYMPDTTGIAWHQICNTYSCALVPEYQCTTGYYGSPTVQGSSSWGCMPCPEHRAGTGVISGITLPYTQHITGCFILDGSEFEDDSGYGRYIGNVGGRCFYKS